MRAGFCIQYQKFVGTTISQISGMTRFEMAICTGTLAFLLGDSSYFHTGQTWPTVIGKYLVGLPISTQDRLGQLLLVNTWWVFLFPHRTDLANCYW